MDSARRSKLIYAHIADVFRSAIGKEEKTWPKNLKEMGIREQEEKRHVFHFDELSFGLRKNATVNSQQHALELLMYRIQHTEPSPVSNPALDIVILQLS